jgi:hypothetical protein
VHKKSMHIYSGYLRGWAWIAFRAGKRRLSRDFAVPIPLLLMVIKETEYCAFKSPGGFPGD